MSYEATTDNEASLTDGEFWLVLILLLQWLVLALVLLATCMPLAWVSRCCLWQLNATDHAMHQYSAKREIFEAERLLLQSQADPPVTATTPGERSLGRVTLVGKYRKTVLPNGWETREKISLEFASNGTLHGWRYWDLMDPLTSTRIHGQWLHPHAIVWYEYNQVTGEQAVVSGTYRHMPELRDNQEEQGDHLLTTIQAEYSSSNGYCGLLYFQQDPASMQSNRDSDIWLPPGFSEAETQDNSEQSGDGEEAENDLHNDHFDDEAEQLRKSRVSSRGICAGRLVLLVLLMVLPIILSRIVTPVLQEAGRRKYSIPYAPHWIEEVCAPRGTNVTEYEACFSTCMEQECCWKDGAECWQSDRQHCDGYSICQNLVRSPVTVTKAPSQVKDGASKVTFQDVFNACVYDHDDTNAGSACVRICHPAACCFEDGGALCLSVVECPVYQACQVLHQDKPSASGNALAATSANATTIEPQTVATSAQQQQAQGNPSLKIQLACTDNNDLLDCVELCGQATCCFTNDIDKICVVTHPEIECDHYQPCEILYAP